MPNISICIPAYKRTAFLKRLLNSIERQTYKDYEVIVSDDSPSTDVEDLCSSYANTIPIKYRKNIPSLGTPENWNEAIRQAEGNWIKLIHDDDWFSGSDSLHKFVKASLSYPASDFIFCAYNNVFEDTGKIIPVFMNGFRKKKMLENPVTLIANNVIGPPSVVMHRNNRQHWYDRNFKWVVDMDFYIRLLPTSKPAYISEPLINVGLNKDQVTRYTFGVPEVQLRENFFLLDKVGEKNLKNIIVFDAWWRLLRNFHITDMSKIRQIGYTGSIPSGILKMVSFQRKIAPVLLRQGILSKTFMCLCYVVNRYG